jgi:hypothetical protein
VDPLLSDWFSQPAGVCGIGSNVLTAGRGRRVGIDSNGTPSAVKFPGPVLADRKSAGIGGGGGGTEPLFQLTLDGSAWDGDGAPADAERRDEGA